MSSSPVHQPAPGSERLLPSPLMATQVHVCAQTSPLCQHTSLTGLRPTRTTSLQWDHLCKDKDPSHKEVTPGVLGAPQPIPSWCYPPLPMQELCSWETSSPCDPKVGRSPEGWQALGPQLSPGCVPPPSCLCPNIHHHRVKPCSSCPFPSTRNSRVKPTRAKPACCPHSAQCPAHGRHSVHPC